MRRGHEKSGNGACWNALRSCQEPSNKPHIIANISWQPRVFHEITVQVHLAKVGALALRAVLLQSAIHIGHARQFSMHMQAFPEHCSE